MNQSLYHQAAHSDVDERIARLGEPLVVFSKLILRLWSIQEKVRSMD